MRKQRQRRTPEEMDTLRAAIYAVAQADRPVSVSVARPAGSGTRPSALTGSTAVHTAG